MRWLSILFFAFSLHAQLLMPGEINEGFVSLFSGKTFGQWEGDEQVWRIEKSRIIGSTDRLTGAKRNLDLVYRGGRFRDFELRFEVKLRNHRSGLRVRAEDNGDTMQGPKIEIDDTVKLMRIGEWAEYVVICEGGKITVKVNGEKMPEQADPSARSGLLGFEIQAVPAMSVELRNLRIRKIG